MSDLSFNFKIKKKTPLVTEKVAVRKPKRSETQKKKKRRRNRTLRSQRVNSNPIYQEKKKEKKTEEDKKKTRKTLRTKGNQKTHAKIIKETFSFDSFSKMNFIDKRIIKNLQKTFEITQPTRIQELSIKPIFDGNDVLMKAKTGTGKTLAFLVPIISKLIFRKPIIQRKDGVFVLIITPTRELCLQIYDVVLNLVKCCVNIVPGTLMGGETRKTEKQRIRKGINVLIATPGRLVDHLEHTQGLSLSNIEYFILDEADRLLEMGFERPVNTIMENLEKNRIRSFKTQNLLISSTLNEKVKKLARFSLNNPVKIGFDIDNSTNEQNTGSEGQKTNKKKQEIYKTPDTLNQQYIVCDTKERLSTLICFLLWKTNKIIRNRKIIIFLYSCDSVEFHYKLFKKSFFPSSLVPIRKKFQNVETNQEANDEEPQNGESKMKNFIMKKSRNKAVTNIYGTELVKLFEHVKLFRLHGNIDQKNRTNTFFQFSKATSGILFSTDVAARGLDLPLVDWIVQYDPPTNHKVYVHRVGRTARIGNKGNSLLFLMPNETDYLDVLKEKKHKITEMRRHTILSSLISDQDLKNNLIDPSIAKQYSVTQRQVVAIWLHKEMEKIIEENELVHDLARRGFNAYIRSYLTHPHKIRKIFDIKKVHLGHLAKSFALKETPTQIGKYTSNQYRKKKPQNKGIAQLKKEEAIRKRKFDKEELNWKAQQFNNSTRHPNFYNSKSKQSDEKKLLNMEFF
ncbi:atp-dependent RNA helicase ddx31-related [Anaeramoeba flamelloides]|uniref:ATP-dependent RNA helicase n=1 Tax=Anaeramoeba flamelloides TaxID=1746091 RepID=A0ABQ8YGC4_9EUKA|nr:atp-dependent RNA helicase ddx31-related [Anaeramoeba flamelloides]